MKRGKKTRAWDKTRATLKKEFMRLGVTACELRYEGCKINSFLGFAHSKRRRFINDEETLREVCLACQNCHQILDRMSHADTEAKVKEIIESRATRVYAA